MPDFFKRLRKRGPGQTSAGAEQGRGRPSLRERIRIRRRLRSRERAREALLLDLGALVYELHRQGRREPALLQAKAAELRAVDEEVQALSEALNTDRARPQPAEPAQAEETRDQAVTAEEAGHRRPR